MRRQLPVYSPLSIGAIAGAFGAAVASRSGEVEALERRLLERFSADAVRLTTSGTHALQIAVGLLPPLSSGERVVAMPAYSCYDLVTAAVGAGAHIRFYDVDPVTLSPDLDGLRAAVAEGVSGVVAGNLYGYPVDWPGIRSITSEAGVTVIEDAAQGVGTLSPEGSGGSVGDLTVLSFGRGKGWTGGGGGAMLARGARGPRTDDMVEATRGHAFVHSGAPRRGQRLLRSSIITTAAWALGRPSLYGIPTAIPGLGLGETTYKEPTEPGPMPTFSAALARRTDRAAAEAFTGRRHVAVALLEVLSGSDGITVATPIGGVGTSAFLRLPVLALSRDRAMEVAEAGARLGVQRGYPSPLPQLPAARSAGAESPDAFPGAAQLSTHLLTLPTHRWIGTKEIEALARLIDEHPR